ncbi:BlaI/MecI/CopY family transcriptional regulator [Anaerocolumna sp. MB42-C2]|uniref:BlaI/MecI/CopY family transcriptional regulator n=1 Tax=Anaerocolumna sp. MB42-C2 TaxID=3070997 RepID=UPI0027DF7CC8|nr:BlaI/MecI/CopY family transcriptional regulator [Anaerocolumna sp. MB42-C2]WMJ86293.1 BlaI/MecI/CopY family transcriptional regulator [Anaerocolumna sp. MB42-C2]
MNKLAQKISDSELEVMRVLWSAKKAVTLAEIRKTLSAGFEWEDSTIKTLLRRLYSKGVLKQEKRDVYYYTPLVSREEYEEYTTQTLLNKLYQGNAKNLIASLVSSNKLSQADIKELKDMFKVGDKNE